MPPKRAVEGKEPVDCILTMGRFNNVVAWDLAMRDIVGKLYGDTANFLTNNERHVFPYPMEADCIHVPPAAIEGGPVPMVTTAAVLAKLREECYTSRIKSIAQQKSDEKKMWSIMCEAMSTASQGKVREEANFTAAELARDCVILWEMIRRTHLTHIYVQDDPMLQLDIREQEMRYASLKQGETEYVVTFKLRFDAQVRANNEAGVAAVSEQKRAMDFLYKLDPKRFGRILAFMQRS